MVVIDAGVDHRDGDALAAEAVDLLDLVHAGHRVAVDVRGRRVGRLGGGDLEHGVHGPHALDLAELLRIGVVHLDGHAVPAGGEVLLDLERDRGVLGALGHGVLRGGRRRLRAAAERGLALDLDQPAAGDGGLPRGAELVGRGDLDAELGGGAELLGGLAVGERGGAHQHASDERRAGGGREQAAGSGKIWSGQRHRRRPSRREGGRCARERSPRDVRCAPPLTISPCDPPHREVNDRIAGGRVPIRSRIRAADGRADAQEVMLKASRPTDRGVRPPGPGRLGLPAQGASVSRRSAIRSGSGSTKAGEASWESACSSRGSSSGTITESIPSRPPSIWSSSS